MPLNEMVNEPNSIYLQHTFNILVSKKENLATLKFMCTITSIDLLLTSWDTVAMQAGLSDAPATSQSLVQSLFLVTINGELQFQQKTKRSLLDCLIRFIAGEPGDQSFRAQVAKVKLLYASIQNPLTDEQKAKYLRLEERINTLGRYVFARRAEKTLFIFEPPNIAHYQVRVFSQTEQLIKPDLLKRSLFNPTWKHCWLNASLKFLAASELYDAMLTTAVKDPTLEALRKTLFRMIEALRKNWDQHLINALHQELIKELQSGPFTTFFHEQQDADEFIVQLNNHFPAANREEIWFAKLYKSLADNVWKAGSLLTTDKLQITPTDETSFDIEQAFMAESHLEDVREYFKGKSTNSYRDPLDFLGYDAVTRYPDQLEIMLKRSVGFNFFRNSGHVSTSKIKLSETGTITVLEHEPVYRTHNSKGHLVDVKQKNLCVFRAVAAIERCGGTSDQGHYVAHTRAQNGVITTHDDSKITSNRSEAVWANAYYLMLELVERMPIPAK